LAIAIADISSEAQIELNASLQRRGDPVRICELVWTRHAAKLMRLREVSGNPQTAAFARVPRRYSVECLEKVDKVARTMVT
jgi:hypothetical protein